MILQIKNSDIYELKHFKITSVFEGCELPNT